MFWLYRQSREAGPVVALLAFVAWFVCVAVAALAVAAVAVGVVYGGWLLLEG